MKARLLLWSTILLPSLLFIFAGQCENGAPAYVGNWSTGAKTLWAWDEEEAVSEEITVKNDLSYTEDTFESLIYFQEDSEWVPQFGGKGTITVSDGDIMMATFTNEYDPLTGEWKSDTGTLSSQFTISDNTMTVVNDINNDGIFDDTNVFADGANLETIFEYDFKMIFFRQ
jgi:hypothetical protein